MQSLWQDTVKMPRFPQQEKDLKTDVLIVGGGLTGLLCAYFLKSAGVDCLLSENDTICAHTSGHTTAKITVQHGCCYQKILADYGKTGAQQYLNANRSALAAYRQICTSIDCDFEETDAAVFARTEQNMPAIEEELAACDALGIPAAFTDSSTLPLPAKGGICIKNQAQFHPLKFCFSLARDLTIFEHTFVRGFDGTRAYTNHGFIDAKRVIIATHFPFIDSRGLYFMKMYQHRSYVLALENAPRAGGMFLEHGGGALSFRDAHGLLLLGGGGHKTGAKGGGFSALEAFAGKQFPQSRIRYRQAAQDCMSLDGIPYIGKYAPKLENFYVATGFNKWGMSSAMAAAQILTDMLTGRGNENAAVFSPQRSIFKPQLLVNGLSTVGNLLTPLPKRCTHLGCALHWNPQEHSWDCACHGSRFDEDGTCLDNPATDGLKKPLKRP